LSKTKWFVLKLFGGVMEQALMPETGGAYRYTRQFTRADILEFARITGDAGKHHVNPNGPVVAQGLLVASIVTKLGGDMNYIARTMDFEMLKPVYEGESVTGEVRVVSLIRTARRVKLQMLCTCFNAAGDVVISGKSRGLIWLDNAG
jgi:3-hydroxybutyryl-CoA dehydratase